MKKANALTFISNYKTINFLLIIACSVLFIACPGVKTSYILEIGINNKTKYKLIVEVFPKEEYLCPTTDALYSASSGSGGHSDRIFTLKVTEHETIYGAHYQPLYKTRKLDYTPTELTKKIFDSIIIAVNINPDIDSTIILKFREKGSINYKTNMYESDTNWLYKEIYSDDKRTNFTVTYEYMDRYTFNIKTDFIEIQNK